MDLGTRRRARRARLWVRRAMRPGEGAVVRSGRSEEDERFPDALGERAIVARRRERLFVERDRDVLVVGFVDRGEALEEASAREPRRAHHELFERLLRDLRIRRRGFELEPAAID